MLCMYKHFELDGPAQNSPLIVLLVGIHIEQYNIVYMSIIHPNNNKIIIKTKKGKTLKQWDSLANFPINECISNGNA